MSILIVTEFFIKFVSPKKLIHHAKQRPCNFSSEKGISVYILENVLSEKMQFY